MLINRYPRASPWSYPFTAQVWAGLNLPGLDVPHIFLLYLRLCLRCLQSILATKSLFLSSILFPTNQIFFSYQTLIGSLTCSLLPICYISVGLPWAYANGPSQSQSTLSSRQEYFSKASAIIASNNHTGQDSGSGGGIYIPKQHDTLSGIRYDSFYMFPCHIIPHTASGLIHPRARPGYSVCDRIESK